jgi:hypothetical protein
MDDNSQVIEQRRKFRRRRDVFVVDAGPAAPDAAIYRTDTFNFPTGALFHG